MSIEKRGQMVDNVRSQKRQAVAGSVKSLNRVLVLTGLGYFCFQSMIMASERMESNFLINPLRKYHHFKALRPFSQELRELRDGLIKKGYVSEIAIYFRSLNDGVWIGINERDRFAPASLMKVPIMIAYLKEAQEDPALLQKELIAEETDRYSQYIPSKVQLKKGRHYTVDQLLEIMIKDSNNDAMVTLLNNINEQAIMKVYRQLGYVGPFTGDDNFLTLKTYVGTLRVLYNATYLNEEMSQKALKYLTGTEFGKGIAAGVPETVMLVGKFGEYGSVQTNLKQLHDIGIVYHPDNPYLLGIMTRGDDYDKLAEAIKEISSFIYREVDQQYQSQDKPEFLFGFENED
jgi:beta-lactamase class A